MTQLPLPPKSAAPKPKKQGSGLLPALGVGVLLFLAVGASALSEKESLKEFKAFTVALDSRTLYDHEPVELQVTKQPVCGNETSNGIGIKGAGVLKTLMDKDPLEVVVEPCIDGPEEAVRLPN